MSPGSVQIRKKFFYFREFSGRFFEEGYLLKIYTVKTVARFLDLTERRVRQLKDEGVIEEYTGMSGFYDLIPTAHNYINYLRRRNPESCESIDYNTERAKLMKAKRKDLEFDLGLKEKDLHTSADVETAVTNIFLNFKSRLMSIPAKLSPILSKKTDKAEIYKIIKDTVYEALNELSDYNKIFGREETHEDSDA